MSEHGQAFFHYRGDQLHCEDVSLARIADEVGTPTYVYSRGALESAYRAFDEALAGIKHVVCCSVKANGNLSVLAVLARLGAGSDIVSGGELYRVLRAGGDPKKCLFSGVGKTVEEMRQALAAGVMAFNVESAEELHVLDGVARAQGVRAPVALRVNPDVDAQTHPYISTGLKNNKFGISTADARELFRVGRGLAGVEMIGITCHIGSQLTKTSPFADAIARLNDLVLALHADGARLRFLDIGGGLGIDYEKQGDAAPPSPGEYGEIVRRALAPIAHLDLTLACEPGRVIVGRAGVLLTRVLYRKSNEGKHFTVVDAAFNDLMRPALYGAYHPMQPVRRVEGREVRPTDVVGPICESSDFLARDRPLPVSEQGELLSVGAAGAYGFAMASNYNTRPRAAEVMVRGGEYTVVRTRETLEQLVANERIVTD